MRMFQDHVEANVRYQDVSGLLDLLQLYRVVTVRITEAILAWRKSVESTRSLSRRAGREAKLTRQGGDKGAKGGVQVVADGTWTEIPVTPLATGGSTWRLAPAQEEPPPVDLSHAEKNKARLVKWRKYIKEAKAVPTSQSQTSKRQRSGS